MRSCPSFGVLTALAFTALASACVDDPDSATSLSDAPCEHDVEQPWLLAIDEDEGSVDALIQINLEPDAAGEVTVLCDDLELPAGFPADTNFTSLSYNRGYLYASAMRETWGDTLLRIDPCACTAAEVGAYGFELVSGLASTGTGALFGLTAQSDALIEIDPLTANAEATTALAADWDANGLSWTDPDSDLLYALDASGDRLHSFRGADGAALASVALSHDFSAAGIEYHPGLERLYACGVRDQGTSLFAIDPQDGVVSLVAEAVFTTTCDNLAQPSGPIVCAQ